MTRRPDPRVRERRAIVVGVITCLAIVAAGRGLPALGIAERSARVRLEAARTRVSRVQPERAAEGVRGSDDVTTRSFVIVRPTAAEAAAELGRHATQLARFAGLSVEYVAPAQYRRDADLSRSHVTAVTVAATGDARAVLEYLRELELGSPVVGIAALRLVRQGAGAAGDGVRVELTIRAVAERSSNEGAR